MIRSATNGSSNFSLGKPLDFNLKPYPTDHSQGSMSFKIDSLINNKYIPVPDFIKIDVDGLEHKVIEGAKQTLKNKKSFLNLRDFDKLKIKNGWNKRTCLSS